MNTIKKTVPFGPDNLVLETGEIARQASGAVLASLGDTVVLSTVVGARSASPGRDFFPLTVDYVEKTYAAGKIPGGFFKREGRPSEKEILTARLVDRPLRPLFPDGYRNEVQVILTVLSLDPQIDPDIPALIGASAALAISGLPFAGPIGAARVGYIDNQFILNPTFRQTSQSMLDLVVAGTKNAVLMVESEARVLPEAVMLDAVLYGHQQMQAAIAAIDELAAEAGKEPMRWEPPPVDQALVAAVDDAARDGLEQAYRITDKLARRDRVHQVHGETVNAVAGEGEGRWSESEVGAVFGKLEKSIVRRSVLGQRQRIDGRSPSTVRDISSRVKLLPRTHGSSLFTRGETQAIVTTTLGTTRDAQIVDALEGERREPFMLHYNFPPFCVGETGRMLGPRRREIGHGRLARRSMQAVMPRIDDFPYVIRVVSEVTESNGSSSMATVCGTSLSLMDAGVPIAAPVAGIAMGLIKEGEDFLVLSDIMGDEDHLGDMDFKVAGTSEGITALQMDIKIDGITREIMEIALAQAREGRIHIIENMNRTLPSPRLDMSEFAPRIISFRIHPEKIRDVIGKGGSVIRSLTDETGVTIDISDDGTVKIASVDAAAGQEARRRIEQITADVEVGTIYDGRVAKLMDFGAFVNILPGRDGLVHISQISEERVERVSDKLSEGDRVRVKVLEVDRQGRIRLSMKAVPPEQRL